MNLVDPKLTTFPKKKKIIQIVGVLIQVEGPSTLMCNAKWRCEANPNSVGLYCICICLNQVTVGFLYVATQ